MEGSDTITGDPIFPAAREALIRGYRSERELSDAALEWLPLFLYFAAGPRHETEQRSRGR